MVSPAAYTFRRSERSAFLISLGERFVKTRDSSSKARSFLSAYTASNVSLGNSSPILTPIWTPPLPLCAPPCAAATPLYWPTQKRSL
eukprot:608051-Prymnesium_polylepis.1